MRYYYEGPFKVYLDDRALTLPIEDEKRAALAYNVLYAVGEENAAIDGTFIEDGELSVIGADGEAFTPPLDEEWYGDDAKFQAALLDKIMAAAEELDEPIDRAKAWDRVDNYTVIPKGLDIKSDDVVFVTQDFDKAVEISNFLKYGMDPSVTLSLQHVDPEYRDVDMIDVTRDNLQIMNYDGAVFSDLPEPYWAKGEMNPDVIMIYADSEMEDRKSVV